MSCRYQVRTFESVDQDGAVSAGTKVAPTAQAFSVYAYSAEEAEKTIATGVLNGKLARGRVYQIWPFLGNGEFTRSLAISLDGASERVLLDPACGPFSELRQIRPLQNVGSNAMPAKKSEEATA